MWGTGRSPGARKAGPVGGDPLATLHPEHLRDLAEAHGTPLLVIDGPTVTGEVGRFTRALSQSPGGRLLYASKALSLVPLISRMARVGSDIEAVSPGEVLTALEAGVQPSRLLVNGSPKSPSDIEFYVRSGIGTFVLDAWEEVPVLETALATHGAEASVLIRYTPAKAPDTHRYVQTAGEDSKFGFLREEVLRLADRLTRSERLHFLGIHVHVGSNLKTIQDHLDAAIDTTRLIEETESRTGTRASVLDLGGGFATPTESAAPDVARLVADVDAHLRQHFGDHRPSVWLEPGRALIEGAGTLVYRVLSVKDRPSGRLVLLDGGMGDNIRPALYGAAYLLRFWPERNGRRQTYEVYGRYCESGDRIGPAESGLVLPGDLAVVEHCGAYTYSMASNYNRVGRPAVVWVDPDGVSLLARREEVTDILRLDRIAAEQSGVNRR